MWLLGGTLPPWFVALLNDENDSLVPEDVRQRMGAWRDAVVDSLVTRLRLWPSRTRRHVATLQTDSVQWATSEHAKRFGGKTKDVCEKLSELCRGKWCETGAVDAQEPELRPLSTTALLLRECVACYKREGRWPVDGGELGDRLKRFREGGYAADKLRVASAALRECGLVHEDLQKLGKRGGRERGHS